MSAVDQFCTYINEFRVEQCQLFLQHKCNQHRPFTCFYWHFMNQRRRRPCCVDVSLSEQIVSHTTESMQQNPSYYNYNPDVYCDDYDEQTGICPRGNSCEFVHRNAGDTERKYHPRYYKSVWCFYSSSNNESDCQNGLHCPMVHQQNEFNPTVAKWTSAFQMPHNTDFSDQRDILMSSLLKDQLFNDQDCWNDFQYVTEHYKTMVCQRPPRLCRQGYACPQYHNPRDRRRNPFKFAYRSTTCPNVKPMDEWQEPCQCDKKDLCQLCHSRTEQQFHPEIYKSTRCQDILKSSFCPRGQFCAFAHSEDELKCNRPRSLTGSNQALDSRSTSATNTSAHPDRFDVTGENNSDQFIDARLQSTVPVSQLFIDPMVVSSPLVHRFHSDNDLTSFGIARQKTNMNAVSLEPAFLTVPTYQGMLLAQFRPTLPELHNQLHPVIIHDPTNVTQHLALASDAIPLASYNYVKRYGSIKKHIQSQPSMLYSGFARPITAVTFNNEHPYESKALNTANVLRSRSNNNLDSVKKISASMTKSNEWRKNCNFFPVDKANQALTRIICNKDHKPHDITHLSQKTNASQSVIDEQSNLQMNGEREQLPVERQPNEQTTRATDSHNTDKSRVWPATEAASGSKLSGNYFQFKTPAALRQISLEAMISKNLQNIGIDQDTFVFEGEDKTPSLTYEPQTPIHLPDAGDNHPSLYKQAKLHTAISKPQVEECERLQCEVTNDLQGDNKFCLDNLQPHSGLRRYLSSSESVLNTESSLSRLKDRVDSSNLLSNNTMLAQLYSENVSNKALIMQLTTEMATYRQKITHLENELNVLNLRAMDTRHHQRNVIGRKEQSNNETIHSIENQNDRHQLSTLVGPSNYSTNLIDRLKSPSTQHHGYLSFDKETQTSQ